MKKLVIDASTRDYSLEIQAETLKLQGLDHLVAEAKAAPDADIASIDAEADAARSEIQARLDDFISKQIPQEQRVQLLDMTPEEEAAVLAQAKESEDRAAAQKIQDLINSAKDALAATDITAFRCLKAGIAFPQEWQDYTEALRLVVETGVSPLPDRPPYPEGT